MDPVKEHKKRQKELMKEWKVVSTHYAKGLKSLEDTSSKIGHYHFVPIDDSEYGRLPGVQSDDIVMWKDHVILGQQKLYGSITGVREILKQRKKIKSTKPIKLHLKRKHSKKFINLEELVHHLEAYGSLTNDLVTQVTVTQQLIAFGNKRVVGGELTEDNATKLRGELVSLNSRWNKLNGRILRSVDRYEQFVQDILKEYKQMGQWLEKADNMVQWLTECEKLMNQEPEIATEFGTLQEQLQDNQEFLCEGREYQPSALDVLRSGDKLVETNRLDKQEAEYVEKTLLVLRNRWNGIEEHLEERQNIIKERLDSIRKETTADQLKPWRAKAVNLARSLNSSQDMLDSVENRLSDDNKYETLQRCTAAVREIEHQLLNQSNQALTEVSSTGATWMSQRQLTQEDDQEVEQTVNVLHHKMTQLEQAVKLKKNKLQHSTAEHVNQSISECEQSINDLDNASLENFSAVGSNVNEVQTQINELQQFEDRMEEEENKFQQVREQTEKVVKGNMMDEPNNNRLSYRLKELEWRYKELWREHDHNKGRILQALLVYSSESMAAANSWLDEAETMVAAVEGIDDHDREAVREAKKHQEHLNEAIAAWAPKVRSAAMLGRRIVKDQLIKEDDLVGIEQEMDILEQRLEDLKQTNSNNQTRLDAAMTDDSAVEPPVAVGDMVEVSELEAGLESFPDDIDALPTDEGFAEEEDNIATEDLVEPVQKDHDDVSVKLVEFGSEIKDMNQWMDESTRLTDNFYLNMHTKGAGELQQTIEERWSEIENKQGNINFINNLGKEIASQQGKDENDDKINEELFNLNQRWRDCQSALDTACEVDVPRRDDSSRASSGCCPMMVLRKRLAAICAYN